MCISIPAQIISLEDGAALVRVDGCQRRVLLLFDGAKSGDWILLQGSVGFAPVETEDALEIARLLKLQS